MVGYFYTSGFYVLYKSLEHTEKIRILIGISTSKQTLNLIRAAQSPLQGAFEFSHAETKEEFSGTVAKEMESSEDNSEVEEGVNKFIEWLLNGKMEIKAYPSENIHAKIYIMTFVEGDKDVGRVITGSSNFTQAGLIDNLEFNVELKNRADYEFALAKFNELWENARYSKKELIEKAGVYLSELGLENKMKPLVGNRILYPDGTVNSFIQRYLREQVVKLFEAKPKRTAKKTAA